MSAIIIDAKLRFAKRHETAKTIREATKEEAARQAAIAKAEADGWTLERLRRNFGPSLNQLPFVETTNDGSVTKMARNYWIDRGKESYQEGRNRADQTIAAIYADYGGGGHKLQRIFEGIVSDTIARRARGGRGSRRMSATADGFLDGLSRFICASIAMHQATRDKPDGPRSA